MLFAKHPECQNAAYMYSKTLKSYPFSNNSPFLRSCCPTVVSPCDALPVSWDLGSFFNSCRECRGITVGEARKQGSIGNPSCETPVATAASTDSPNTESKTERREGELCSSHRKQNRQGKGRGNFAFCMGNDSTTLDSHIGTWSHPMPGTATFLLPPAPQIQIFHEVFNTLELTWMLFLYLPCLHLHFPTLLPWITF